MSVKSLIEEKLKEVETNLGKMINSAEEYISVLNYKSLVSVDNQGKQIWTKAFQKAFDENEYILIPASESVYYIDDTLILSSNRHIKADSC